MHQMKGLAMTDEYSPMKMRMNGDKFTVVLELSADQVTELSEDLIAYGELTERKPITQVIDSQLRGMRHHFTKLR